MLNKGYLDSLTRMLELRFVTTMGEAAIDLSIVPASLEPLRPHEVPKYFSSLTASQSNKIFLQIIKNVMYWFI